MHSSLGNVLLQLGKFDQAAAAYERALRSSPAWPRRTTNWPAFSGSKASSTRPGHDFAKHRPRPRLCRGLQQPGQPAEDQGQLDDAAAHFERALALKPGLFPAHFNLGDIFHSQGKLEQARQRFDKRSLYAPTRPRPTTTWAMCWKTRTNSTSSHAVRAHVALRPDLFQAHYNLANVLRTLGRFDQAVASYRRALALNPHYAEAHNNLGNVLKIRAISTRHGHVTPKPWPSGPITPKRIIAEPTENLPPDDADLAALEALATDPGELPPEKMLFSTLPWARRWRIRAITRAPSSICSRPMR